MSQIRLCLIAITLLAGLNSQAQNVRTPDIIIKQTSLQNEAKPSKNLIKEAYYLDSAVVELENIPERYLNQINNKIHSYSKRVSNKTERTLTKLSRWENRILAILQKVSPEAAQKLFANNQLTFSLLLEQMKKGESFLLSYEVYFDKYRDDVNTSLKYISEQKSYLDSIFIKKAQATQSKMEQLGTEEDKREALEQFIKERKRALIAQSLQHIGKNKYLKKINKEVYYYAESINNYKALFNDPKKAETVAKNILNKLPAFQKFLKKNSQLATLFRMPEDNIAQEFPGLQTRASVQTLMNQQISLGGTNPQQIFEQNMAEAKSELSKLRQKLSSISGEGNDMPGFKPNNQKTKSLLKRIEFGGNVQSQRSNGLLPVSSDLAASAGYKLNDKTVIGIAVSYKVGWGSGWQHIKLSHEGMGLRSYVDYKMAPIFGKIEGIWISGGYEQNHFAAFSRLQELKDFKSWQTSGLLGLKKKYRIGKKGNDLQLLWDFLSYHQSPKRPPILFRLGFNF